MQMSKIQYLSNFKCHKHIGIHYEGTGLLDVYCTMGSNRMHRILRLSASNSTASCNKRITILDLNIVFPLLH